MATITNVEGIGKVNGRKLQKAGIRTQEGLLKAGTDRKGRKALC